MEKSTHSCDS